MWMGTEKMIKLIIGNYLIAGTCYAFGESLNIRAQRLLQTPETTFRTISYQTFAHFLQNGQLTFILVLFAVLVLLVYTSSTISVANLDNAKTEKLRYILLIPLTLLSFIFSLSLSLMGQGLATEVFIKSISQTFGIISEFVRYFPIRMVAHGVLVLLITSHIHINIGASKKTTLPEGLDEL
ncbi:MAG: hypothetical protein LBP53_02685 [Candidatus Peribacteria bacterium]|jgi:TRAP-type C4-dicarboxylate transport system permease small subunit|nr:hypothetical protein [Candidatus Peribacteria bacterium]